MCECFSCGRKFDSGLVAFFFRLFCCVLLEVAYLGVWGGTFSSVYFKAESLKLKGPSMCSINFFPRSIWAET
ncbi:hypothetical protein B0H11DRAFT_164205 [Mycena galericulata]|nr:hypothetical protein B0H11DRAFT_164205 [Mycena galericulata]